MGTQLMLTQHEAQLIRELRELTDNSNPPISICLNHKTALVIGLLVPTTFREGVLKDQLDG